MNNAVNIHKEQKRGGGKVESMRIERCHSDAFL